MKFLSAFLASALVAQAAPSDPGTAAIAFLEKVRSRKIDLKPGGDTALAAQTVVEKRRQIDRRLERMANDLGSDPLEVSSVTQDGDFAAVIVRKSGGFDPAKLQVFPIALVKQAAGWTAAPVPASFENSGFSYAAELRKRLELLEDWMLREQVADLEKLREEAAAKLRQKIEVGLPLSRLRSFTAKQATEEFLTACQNRDHPALLGLLGGLAAELPSDWPLRLKAVENALATGQSPTGPWRLLTAPEVVRVQAESDEAANSGYSSIVCLDPASENAETPQAGFHLVHLELTKSSEGLWRIDPPPAFLFSDEMGDEESDMEMDRHLTDSFPSLWLEAHPPTPQATPELAQEVLLKALAGRSLEAALRVTLMDADPESARESCLATARLWWKIHEPSAVRHVIPLAIKADPGLAISMMQIFSSRQPNDFDPLTIYYEKTAAGWLWNPNPKKEAGSKIKTWIDQEMPAYAENWQQKMVSNITVLLGVNQGAAPSEEAARACVASWLTALQNKDVPAALANLACLNDEKSAAMTLRNMGNDILSAQRSTKSAEVLAISRGEFVTTASLRTLLDGKTYYPIYPVVQTANGAKILVEIELFAANRRRDFLNGQSIRRLEKIISPAMAADLKKQLEMHQQRINQTSAE